jgi:hypothetical protein
MGATVPHNMSTTNVGQILPAERGSLRGKHLLDTMEQCRGGRAWRNAFTQPSEFTTGANCEVGGTDWDNIAPWCEY